ncbi:multidrug resistance-associated ABC transporter [Cubamyces sp. BRFM 1775]|nr:multidrug resistance-associated ABC transporter [Cubamyces sp. BRFM 1775]
MPARAMYPSERLLRMLVNPQSSYFHSVPSAMGSQMIPLYATGLSALILLAQAGLHAYRSARDRQAAKGPPSDSDAMMEDERADAGLEDAEGHGLKGFVHRSGGRVVLTYKLARLLSCVALLCLAIASVCNRYLGSGSDFPDSTLPRADWDWVAFVQCAVYLYCAILALVSVSSPWYSALVSSHLSFVLLLTWVVYLWRDVLPLGTTTRSPADAHEGTLLWAKFAILTVAAIIIPVLIPRPPLNTAPGETVNKEQRAGWYERRMYSWLNETVAKAHRVKHLPLDELPPLASMDSTSVLVSKSLKHLDPLQTQSKRHLFWGFITLFHREYMLAAVLTAGTSVIGLSWPLATQGILASLEAGNASTVRPWVWLAVLFLGPTVEMVCEEWYQWAMNRMSVHTEAIVTELLFQHALRIRVKSETSSDDSRDESAAASDSAPPTDGGDDSSAAEEKRKDSFLVGKLNNLITSDLASVTEGNKEWLRLFIQSPARIGIAIAFMYSVLGWSALVGLATLVALLPFPAYLSGWIQSFQKGMMSTTDARVQVINEVLNVIRMIKLFGWEPRVAAQIEERRAAELKFLSKTRWLEIVNNLFNYVIPLITMVVTFATYTVVMKGELTASKLFSSNAAFLIIQQQLHAIFFQIPVLTQARVSLDRINSFLHETELLDEFTDATTAQDIVSSPTIGPSAPVPESSSDILGIKQTSFTWSDEVEVSTPSTVGSQQSRKFVLHIDGEVLFKRGRINLIVGPTGSGKTSLLMALLGEMHAIPMGPESFVSLPRTGGVAYAAQESWVLSDTIRNNILFGAPFDEVRYAKVIQQCALERDLSLFDAGDKTEVGEKGITLSGGQKARITLARAIYSSAEILLLDDVLAALDVHTGRWIVDQCFKGDLVRGRTVLLVSHNVALTRPIADFVVALGLNGRIASQGSLEKTLREDKELSAELAEEEAQLKLADEELPQSQFDSHGIERAQKDADKSGKLVVAEEVEEGQVGWNTLRLYLMNTSTRPLLYWAVYLSMLAVTHSVMNSQSYLLGYWAAQYENHAPSEVSVPYYLSLYGVLVLGTMAAYAVVWFFFIIGSMHASKVIHNRLVSSILGTTLRWLDITPTSRIIARCTSDIQAIDTNVPRYLLGVVECTVFLLLRVITTALMAPIFIIFASIVGVAGASLGRIYVKAQMCVKREMSNTRAPVLGHFGSAISGLVSIRAYGAQDMFKNESYSRLDRYNRAALIYYGLNRWITVRVDLMGTVLSVALAAYIIYVARLSASDAGFAMTMAAGFSINILFWVRTINHLQVCANSIERVQQYLTIEQEPKPSASGIPPAYWPANGKLCVEKLSARYSADGPRVLHEISFEVKSGERIGIVGRTGSGKSSLTLALLRCILTEGTVYYDGIATDSINLDALRSNITIIPQTPELLSGTPRKNLDPFEQHDDATLNDALRSAGLFSLQQSMNAESGGCLTLDSEIAGGGGNLSVGQRQILALARAIVRRSKLLILDEATSAIDYDTDAIIQNSLREELGRDVTVITVAHRLQSIMDADKIMVLDAGRIVEYDAPRILLQKEGGYFRGLVDGSGDKAALYAQAGCAV